MRVPWKLKSFVFSCIDVLNAPGFLYFLQKYVTRRSRVSGELTVSPIWSAHKRILQKYEATEVVFEFGAGKNLAQNLYLSDTCTRQVVVDLNPMLDLSIVEAARVQISARVRLRSEKKVDTLGSLGDYGIQYRAPYDARKTHFDDKSIDACISTNTLEHIPKEAIYEIFLELHRTLKDDGVVSAKIDYSDHYAHTDDRISLLNFLIFDALSWEKYNHNCHYQNRLRHREYLRIFEEAGFDVVEEDLFYDEVKVPDDIKALFPPDDDSWYATSGHVVLKKAI